MDVVPFLVVSLLCLAAVLIAFGIWKRKRINHKIYVLALLLFILAFGSTYIPHQVVTIDPANVSIIKVFDGNSGQEVVISDHTDIGHIITNLNEQTFQKGKPSFGYMGYRFRTTIYDRKGNEVKTFIINSHDRIRYKGFFYTADGSIDYDYMENVVEKE
ncbi:hypothetical protein SAMN05216389_101242 [Oceanobacillus limi]|uniref:Uncharacterized protein n=2 Tax=Oceanobacillus limi TaxID=930131 RepID=A0A1H9Y7U4_9BACI|nr:hypothetical protein SAMN05216389_101242 [Oceanobacillus limi]